MIYLTGDTHIPIDINKLNTKNFSEQKEMTKSDFVIVLGDFGLLWKEDKTYRYWKKWLEERNFTTLWIDGNHENSDWINSLKVSEWHGGKVHKISDSIIHLMRGQIFEIEGSKFFIMGGAESIDKIYRTEGVSWWEREIPSYEEEQEAIDNLLKYKNHVDYVLTHTCPKSLIFPMFHVKPLNDPTTKFLDYVWHIVDCKKWYFGHWHEDKEYGRFQCLYNNVIKIGGY